MEEQLITIPVGTFVWLIVCTVSCIVMLIVQIGFYAHDNKVEKLKRELKNESEDEDIGRTE